MSDDGDEPWKDAETLRRLYHEQDLNQSEMADELGTTPSTISYWMDKLEVNTTHTTHQSTLVNAANGNGDPAECNLCGDEVPGGVRTGNSLCQDCLDEVRMRDYHADYDHYPDFLSEHAETA